MIMEIISIIASVLILVNYLVKDALKFRVIAIVSGILFVAYGIYLHSVSIVGMNSACLVINSVYLFKILKKKHHSYSIKKNRLLEYVA